MLFSSFKFSSLPDHFNPLLIKKMTENLQTLKALFKKMDEFDLKKLQQLGFNFLRNDRLVLVEVFDIFEKYALHIGGNFCTS